LPLLSSSTAAVDETNGYNNFNNSGIENKDNNKNDSNIDNKVMKDNDNGDIPRIWISKDAVNDKEIQEEASES
jgi:hypothetical protein